MQDSADYAKLYLLIAAVAAGAALISAAATVALAKLTRRLTRATETYANLVREELDLLRAQLESPLLFDVLLSYPYCLVRCRHFGSSNSLPVQIRRVELQLESLENPGTLLAKGDYPFEDYLKPGKVWSKQMGEQVVRAVNRLPSPRFASALMRKSPKEQRAGILTARLHYHLAGELNEIVREYEVWTHWWSTPRLKPIV